MATREVTAAWPYNPVITCRVDGSLNPGAADHIIVTWL